MCVCEGVKIQNKTSGWFVKTSDLEVNTASVKEIEIIMSQHTLICDFFSSLFLAFFSHPTPPPAFPLQKRPTSFYHCGFENRQGEKCLKVLGIQLFQSMNLGRSLKSVLPFIVPCGKICAAKVRRVRRPMTRCLLSARCQLTGEEERHTRPSQGDREREALEDKSWGPRIKAKNGRGGW